MQKEFEQKVRPASDDLGLDIGEKYRLIYKTGENEANVTGIVLSVDKMRSDSEIVRLLIIPPPHLNLHPRTILINRDDIRAIHYIPDKSVRETQIYQTQRTSGEGLPQGVRLGLRQPAVRLGLRQAAMGPSEQSNGISGGRRKTRSKKKKKTKRKRKTRSKKKKKTKRKRKTRKTKRKTIRKKNRK